MNSGVTVYQPAMVWDTGKLVDWQLRQLCALGLVEPFDDACINPNSIDLRLGNQIRRATDGGWGGATTFDTCTLFPGEFVLCHSLETVTIPTWCMALLFSKSSTGRVGLEHLHAGLGDSGFSGQWTFEFHNVAPWPVELVAGKRIMQMTVEKLSDAPRRDYSQTGRYQWQTGPTEAR